MEQFLESATRFGSEVSRTVLEQIEELFFLPTLLSNKQTNAGAGWQSSLARLCSANVLTPRYYLWAAWLMGRRSLDALPFIESNVLAPEWIELRNKLEAFSLFEHVDMELSLPATDQSLADLARQAKSLGPYLSVWATEGIGHYYADSRLSGGKTPTALLQSIKDKDISTAALIPLHAGIGLTLAELVLAEVDEKPCHANNQIANFIQLLRNTVRPEHLEIMYEALGLAARNLFPHLLPTVQNSLSSLSDDLPDYLWHGVGRALYFSPSTLFSRDASGNGFQLCITEPPDDRARHNAVAGFAWALTLVNIRHPRVIAEFLRRHASRIIDDSAFVNGVCSALVIWAESSPDSNDLNRLETFRSDETSLDSSLWSRYIRSACRSATLYCRSEDKHLGKLFRFQPDPSYSSITDHQDFTASPARAGHAG
jgi:hypothetical protein